MKSRFSESQIIQILKEANDGRKVVNMCREQSESVTHLIKLSPKFGRMGASDIRGARSLEKRIASPSSFSPNSACSAFNFRKFIKCCI